MDALVFGATDPLGRCLIAHLLAEGQRVTAVLGPDADTPVPWLTARNADAAGPDVVRTRRASPLSDDLPEARDVYYLAAADPGSGDGARETRATGVPAVADVLAWAAALHGLRRLVYLDGRRTARTEDATLAARARAAGVPLTYVTSGAVIGEGGDASLASLVAALWKGKRPRLPAGAGDQVPVVTADRLVRFLAGAPEGPAGEHHRVADDAALRPSDLIATVTAHTGVRASRLRLPGCKAASPPDTSTGTSPSASPAVDALRAWTDDLVATRFGAAPALVRPYAFRSVAGSRTWVVGERREPTHVLLHGMPMNADLWAPLAERLDGPVLAADLPGLGRSAASALPLTTWMADLLNTVDNRPFLVAHSATCGPAVRFAAGHPDRVSGLVLIAPAFLQPPGARLTRSAAAVPIMRRMSAPRLAAALGVPEGPEIASAVADLGRPGVARSVVRALRSDIAGRDSARQLLARLEVPVRVVVGAQDSPIAGPGCPVDRIDGAGHYPQLTHPDEVARLLGTHRARDDASG